MNHSKTIKFKNITTNSKNYSVHFTIKGQTVDEIKEKLSNFINSPEFLDFHVTTPVFHHCFMPRKLVEAKNFSLDLVDMLDEILIPNQVRWFNTGESIEDSRLFMLSNLKMISNSQAIFIGEIKEGVQIEYQLAKELGIDCILIP